MASRATSEGQPSDIGRARDLHEDLRERLLDDQWMNLDARVLADLINGRTDRFFAWIDTREHGLFSLRIDPTAADRYRLVKWCDRFGGRLDVWSAFGAAQMDPAFPKP